MHVYVDNTATPTGPWSPIPDEIRAVVDRRCSAPDVTPLGARPGRPDALCVGPSSGLSARCGVVRSLGRSVTVLGSGSRADHRPRDAAHPRPRRRRGRLRRLPAPRRADARPCPWLGDAMGKARRRAARPTSTTARTSASRGSGRSAVALSDSGPTTGSDWIAAMGDWLYLIIAHRRPRRRRARRPAPAAAAARPTRGGTASRPARRHRPSSTAPEPPSARPRRRRRRPSAAVADARAARGHRVAGWSGCVSGSPARRARWAAACSRCSRATALDEDTWESIEDTLLTADVGVAPDPGAGRAAAHPAAGRGRRRRPTPRTVLREELLTLVDPTHGPPPRRSAAPTASPASCWSSASTAPARPPRSASSPGSWSPRTARSCSARPTPSAPPPSSSSPPGASGSASRSSAAPRAATRPASPSRRSRRASTAASTS